VIDDSELLRHYAEEGSQEAFEEIVRRNVGLIYSAARHQVGNADHADDVVQMVFADLARKSRVLCRRPVLLNWLYTSTHFTAAKVKRREYRRLLREEQAYKMKDEANDASGSIEWEHLRPVLDHAMNDLDEVSRSAVLLRFFKGLSFPAIGEAMQISEEAARKKVDRGIEKLRRKLASHGITSTSAALALLLANQPALALPASLVVTIPAALPMTGPLIFLMSTTKMSLGALAMVSIIGMACVVGLGFAAREFQLTHRYEVSLAETSKQKSLGTVGQQRFERASPAIQRPTGGAGVATPPLAFSRDTEMRKFLESFPESVSALKAFLKDFSANSFGAFFRSTKLTQEQVQQFQAVMTDYLLGTLTFSNQGDFQPNVRVPPLEFEPLHQILGDAAYQSYQSYARSQESHFLVNRITGSTLMSGNLLSPAQQDQLAQIVSANSAEFQNGGILSLMSIRWEAVLSEARNMMTDDQWKAAEGLILDSQLRQSASMPHLILP